MAYSNFTLKSFLTSILSLTIIAGNAQPKLKESDQSRMQWWKDAKFGMFIHWGVYSVPAGRYEGKEVAGIGEWIMHNAKIPVSIYRGYARQFNPVKYDADAIVKTAKDAGMKYIIITSKHHDGFAMFDSKASDWNIVKATPYGKDILEPLVAACHRQGIKIGFYYSQAQDWNNGGAVRGGIWDKAQDGNMDEYIDRVAIPQVKEILSNYGEIDVLWWDTPVDMTPERAVKLNEIVKMYPKLITNNRLGGGYKGDTETPEQFVPATGFPGRNWETCMTMNDTWGFKTDDQNWKSPTILIRNLADISSKGGNFLLNVGPTSLGEIPQQSLVRLSEIGKWLRVNGDAVYGTSASPFPYLSWGRATRKGQKLYLHVFNYPADGKLVVPMSNKITAASALAQPGKQLRITQSAGRSVITLPAQAPDSINSVIVVDFAGEPDVLPLPMLGKKAMISSQKSPMEKPEYITDQDPRTRWEAAAGVHNATIEIDLGTSANIGSFSLDEPWHPWDNKSQKVQLQYLESGQWKTATKIKTNGTSLTEKIKPVSAQQFRLVIENDLAEPSLLDWQLYRVE